MSLTVATIQTDFNTLVGDSSTDRISAAERLEYITEATIWLQEELKNDHQVRTYELDYLDTVNYYQVTTPLADLLDGADLRRRIGKNYVTLSHKSSREMSEEISQQLYGDDSWAIERRDGDIYLAINAVPQNKAINIDNFDSSVDAWIEDAVTSDMINLVLDNNDFFTGSGSARFDVDVSQSGNNKATMSSTSFSLNLDSVLDTGVFLIDAKIPSATYTTSYTLRWGTDSSNYWTSTVTTDIDGNALADGWQTLAFDWASATLVGTPDETNIAYFKIDLNYSASQADDTGYHYDAFRVAKPETLTFFYVSFIVGTDASLVDIYKFAATTDIPFFSGKYDQYRKAIAHKAAAFCYNNLRLKDDSDSEELEATKQLNRVKAIFPQSITKEVKSFKVMGLNLARRNVGSNSLRRTINNQ